MARIQLLTLSLALTLGARVEARDRPGGGGSPCGGEPDGDGSGGPGMGDGSGGPIGPPSPPTGGGGGDDSCELAEGDLCYSNPNPNPNGGPGEGAIQKERFCPIGTSCGPFVQTQQPQGGCGPAINNSLASLQDRYCYSSCICKVYDCAIAAPWGCRMNGTQVVYDDGCGAPCPPFVMLPEHGEGLCPEGGVTTTQTTTTPHICYLKTPKPVCPPLFSHCKYINIQNDRFGCLTSCGMAVDAIDTMAPCLELSSTSATGVTTLTSTTATGTTTTTTNTVYDAISRQENLQSVKKLIDAAGLKDALSGATPTGYTALLPDDAAFEKIDACVMGKLLLPQNADFTKTILLRHVLASEVGWADFENVSSLTAMSGDILEVETVASSGEPVKIYLTSPIDRNGNSATVTVAPLNVTTQNGVIHTISAPLYPFPSTTLDPDGQCVSTTTTRPTVTSTTAKTTLTTRTRTSITSSTTTTTTRTRTTRNLLRKTTQTPKPTTGLPLSAAKTGKKKKGAGGGVIAAVIVVVLLAVGGAYFFYVRRGHGRSRSARSLINGAGAHYDSKKPAGEVHEFQNPLASQSLEI